MYENKYKNPESSGIGELDRFLNLIADLNEKIELFAIGGTAMVLKNIKEATKDIDFYTPEPKEKIKKIFTMAGLEEKQDRAICNIWYMGKTRIDIFYGDIMGIPFPDDWKELSEHISDKNKLKLYILNWYDIIITKISRAEERDYEDIKNIIEKQKINFKKLKERYYGLAETALISDYDDKFKHLERELK